MKEQTIHYRNEKAIRLGAKPKKTRIVPLELIHARNGITYLKALNVEVGELRMYREDRSEEGFGHIEVPDLRNNAVVVRVDHGYGWMHAYSRDEQLLAEMQMEWHKKRDPRGYGVAHIKNEGYGLYSLVQSCSCN